MARSDFRTPRLFVEDDSAPNLASGLTLRLAPEQQNYLGNVLRLGAKTSAPTLPFVLPRHIVTGLLKNFFGAAVTYSAASARPAYRYQ